MYQKHEIDYFNVLVLQRYEHYKVIRKIDMYLVGFCYDIYVYVYLAKLTITSIPFWDCNIFFLSFRWW